MPKGRVKWNIAPTPEKAVKQSICIDKGKNQMTSIFHMKSVIGLLTKGS